MLRTLIRSFNVNMKEIQSYSKKSNPVYFFTDTYTHVSFVHKVFSSRDSCVARIVVFFHLCGFYVLFDDRRLRLDDSRHSFVSYCKSRRGNIERETGL